MISEKKSSQIFNSKADRYRTLPETTWRPGESFDDLKTANYSLSWVMYLGLIINNLFVRQKDVNHDPVLYKKGILLEFAN